VRPFVLDSQRRCDGNRRPRSDQSLFGESESCCPAPDSVSTGPPSCLRVPFSFLRFPAQAQVNEVQILECSCPSPCSGGVVLSLYQTQIARLNYNANAAAIKAALEAHPKIPTVTVNLYGGTSLCDPTAAGVTTAITFTHNLGDLPGLVVSNAPSSMTLTSSSAGGASFYTVTSACVDHP
jgi:hypothetical protein